MKTLFNHKKQGQEEIVKSLGFLSNDFSYGRLRTYISLETPRLVDFIGESVYIKILDVYQSLDPLLIDQEEDAYYDIDKLTPEQQKILPIIEHAQVYVGLLAYALFAPNHDLKHTTSGRKMAKDQDEVTPWDWQITKSDASLQKTAYKTLDRLIRLLNQSALSEWKNSDAYKKSKALFVYSTAVFQNNYPINHSEQLYFRLVPFMASIEKLEIQSRTGVDLFNRLKKEIHKNDTTDVLSIDEQKLVLQIQQSVVYEALIKAYKLFPIEMFPNKVNFNPKAKTNTEEMVREGVILNLQKELSQQYVQLERLIKTIKTEPTESTESTYKDVDLIQGLKPNNLHVDL